LAGLRSRPLRTSPHNPSKRLRISAGSS
jgi:hypothetical protein